MTSIKKETNSIQLHTITFSIRVLAFLIAKSYNYSNMSLGIAFSIYGFTALISYIPGGYIADRLSAKYLLFISLLLTSLGGKFLLFNPSPLNSPKPIVKFSVFVMPSTSQVLLLVNFLPLRIHLFYL